MSDDVMKTQYRELNDLEKSDMLNTKKLGEVFYNFIEEVRVRGGGDPRGLALAKTKIEEAVMWATKAITG